MKRLIALALLALAACGPRETAPPQQAQAGDEWTNPGGDAGKTHHSVLQDITPANASRLGLAWQAELGTNRGLEASPVVAVNHPLAARRGTVGPVTLHVGTRLTLATGRPKSAFAATDVGYFSIIERGTVTTVRRRFDEFVATVKVPRLRIASKRGTGNTPPESIRKSQCLGHVI